MKQITSTLVAQLQQRAAHSARRRTNHNLHPDPTDPVQRLLNALEPDSYVRPHRHTQPPKWELFTILTGRAAVLLFDDGGRVTARTELAPDGGVHGAELPAGVWHTLVALAPGTVVLEVKPGPYLPNGAADFAPWAPAEGSPEAAALVRRFHSLQSGEDALGE